MKKAAWMLFGILALAVSAAASPAIAQDNYPATPIRLIVGYPPGAIADLATRLLGQKLATQMNGSVIVENKPGAGTQIANEFVAKSKPDGYTLLVNDASIAMGRALGIPLKYDLFTDLAPVSRTSGQDRRNQA